MENTFKELQEKEDKFSTFDFWATDVRIAIFKEPYFITMTEGYGRVTRYK